MNYSSSSRAVALALPLLFGLSACPAAGGDESASETDGTSTGESTPTTGDASTGDAPSDLEPPGERVGSDKLRAAASASPEDLAAMATDERAFAAALFAELPATAENRAISPASVRLAFAQAYAGARTVTKAEIETAVKFTLPPDRLHAAFNSIDLELAARNLPSSGDSGGDDSVQLALVNQVFGLTGVAWEPTFLDILAESYGTAMYQLDFAGDPDGGRVAINAWVDAVTQTRVPELLPKNSIVPDVKVVLVNALRLKAPWAAGFQSVDEAAAFTRIDGTEATVAMMNGLQSGARHVAGVGYEAAELPLRGDELTMVVIVPTAGTFAAFASALDGATLGQIFADLQPTVLDVSLPRFTFSTDLALKKPLTALGMVSSFAIGGADFTGMAASAGDWAISEVYHDVFVAVDEKGVEAAAAAAVVITDTDEGGPEEYFVADRPFLFAIRDRGTDSLLFLGRVLDPAN